MAKSLEHGAKSQEDETVQREGMVPDQALRTCYQRPLQISRDGYLRGCPISDLLHFQIEIQIEGAQVLLYLVILS